MAKLTIKPSCHMRRFKCDHCGEDLITVWGLVDKDGCAHAVYYASMVRAHPEPEAELTVSIGDWSELKPKRKAWTFMQVRPQNDGWTVRVGDAAQPLHVRKDILGKLLHRKQALESPLLPEFFEVADAVVINDPAVSSFLRRKRIDIKGRFEEPLS